MQVFISHAVDDQNLARKISDSLRKAGLEVWDGSDIMPGENWAAKVSEALQKSQAMVVLVTPSSMQSKNVSWEIGYAMGDKAYERRIIPVLADSSKRIPSEKIPWIFNRFPMVSLTRPEHDEENFEKIAEIIKKAA